jgi:glutathione S-transferase
MGTIKLITLYGSPWSERVRWAFAFKGVPYEKQNYRPGVDEEELKKLTGQNQVPVLIADGKVIPDSTAILEWLEDFKPAPALLPRSEKDRAHATLLEELALGVLGSEGRTLIIGRFLRSSTPELQQAGEFFAGKYGYSAYAEEQARRTVKRVLSALRQTLNGRQYLVGEVFSRADLTIASMMTLLKPAPDELFLLPASNRPTHHEPLADEPSYSVMFEWRNEMYRRHRGEVVKP